MVMSSLPTIGKTSGDQENRTVVDVLVHVCARIKCIFVTDMKLFVFLLHCSIPEIVKLRPWPLRRVL